MPATVNGFTGARNSTGLLITAAVHVALGAALLSLGVVNVNSQKPKPIVVTPLPNKPDPIEPVEPKFVPDEVAVPIYAPRFDIYDLPPPPDPGVTATSEKPVDPPPTGGAVVAEPRLVPRAEPVTVAARLDPRYAARFQPPYPTASERLSEEGIVVVRVRIGPDGRVLAAEVLRSSGYPRLDEAAVRHAGRAWRFMPATRDGVGVEGWKEIAVRFELKQG